VRAVWEQWKVQRDRRTEPQEIVEEEPERPPRKQPSRRPKPLLPEAEPLTPEEMAEAMRIIERINGK